MSRRSSLRVVLGRSLSSQLDHLRATLDRLGQRLRDLVAHAVGETVGAAVRQTLHAALEEVAAKEEDGHRPLEPRYLDPPPWEERAEQSWGPTSWDQYSAWQDADEADTPSYRAPAAAGEGGRGAAVGLLRLGCQALAWWLRRHATRRPLLAALGVGAACGVVAYLGGPVALTGAGLAGSVLGLATLTEAAHAGAHALAGLDALD